MSSFERRLGATSVVAISVSTMLGSGIFVLPGLAAARTGPSIWLAYLAAAASVLPAALSKAELGTAMPTSGGTYVYIDRAFGPFAGTVAGIGLWLSLLLKSAFALVGFGAYLAVLDHTAIVPTSLGLLVLIVLLNIRGVLRVSQVQTAVVALALAGLAVLFFAGLGSYDPSRFEPMFPHGSGGFLSAAGFVFVSYAGVTKVAAIAEEIRNPSRNLPIGMLVSLLLVMVVYVGINLILVGCVPMETLVGDLHPIHTLAETLLGPAVGVAAAVLGVLTMTSMANAGLLAASRFPFAMSRDDLLPAPLSRLHRRYKTPTASILASSALMAAAILLLDVAKIAKLASAFVILLYVTESVTVLVLRESGVQWYRPTYRSPGYPWVQLFGIASGLVLLAALGPLSLVAAAAVAVPGLVLYRLYGHRRTARRGVVRQRGRRTELLRRDDEAAGTEEQAPQEEAPGEADVLVALFGRERSAEMLVELAEALAEGGKIQVLHLTELPEQTSLEAFVEGPRASSIRRRIGAMAESRGLDVSFHALASRDIVRTVAAATRRADCRWLVMEWSGRRRFALTIRDPLGWFTDHLPCNLAVFYDAGVRTIREILVHVAPGPHDALALGTADHLAAVHGASLTFVRHLPRSAPPARAQSDASYLDHVRGLVSAPSKALLLRDGAEAEALADTSASYDLLITVGAPRGNFLDRVRGRGFDRLTENAACSVLRLQAPPASRQTIFERYRPSAAPQARDLLSFLHPECLRALLPARRKETMFEKVAEVFARALPDLSEQDIVDALWQRERTQNTAVGDGVALPHATLESAGRTHLGVFTTERPIDYDAPDGTGVDVFFVTLGTPGDRSTHLELLGHIARLVTGTDALARLRGAKRDAELLSILEELSR